jgi:adenine phosphoribosyltransferase
LRDENLEARLKGVIRNIPDFPQSGIQFKDITPILLDPTLFEESIEAFAQFAKPTARTWW